MTKETAQNPFWPLFYILQNFSKEYLKPALETGLLEPIYPEQPSHPKQKYRLTDKGKKSLNQQ